MSTLHFFEWILNNYFFVVEIRFVKLKIQFHLHVPTLFTQLITLTHDYIKRVLLYFSKTFFKKKIELFVSVN